MQANENVYNSLRKWKTFANHSHLLLSCSAEICGILSRAKSSTAANKYTHYLDKQLGSC